jgi:hypothetical protein
MILTTIAIIYLVSFAILAALYVGLRAYGQLSSQYFAQGERETGLPSSARRTVEGRAEAPSSGRGVYSTAH